MHKEAQTHWQPKLCLVHTGRNTTVLPAQASRRVAPCPTPRAAVAWQWRHRRFSCWRLPNWGTCCCAFCWAARRPGTHSAASHCCIVFNALGSIPGAATVALHSEPLPTQEARDSPRGSMTMYRFVVAVSSSGTPARSWTRQRSPAEMCSASERLGCPRRRCTHPVWAAIGLPSPPADRRRPSTLLSQLPLLALPLLCSDLRMLPAQLSKPLKSVTQSRVRQDGHGVIARNCWRTSRAQPPAPPWLPRNCAAAFLHCRRYNKYDGVLPQRLILPAAARYSVRCSCGVKPEMHDAGQCSMQTLPRVQNSSAGMLTGRRRLARVQGLLGCHERRRPRVDCRHRSIRRAALRRRRSAIALRGRGRGRCPAGAPCRWAGRHAQRTCARHVAQYWNQ